MAAESLVVTVGDGIAGVVRMRLKPSNESLFLAASATF
jgi:hypothetical protein